MGIVENTLPDPQSTIHSPQPLRVAIDARSLGERNTSNRTYWSELVNALGKVSGVEMLLVSNAPLALEDVPANGRVVVVPSPGRWFSLVTLPRVARELEANVVHVQYTVSPMFRTPVVTTIHDVSFFIEPSWFGLKDRLILQRSVPAACRRAAVVLAPSATCREEILAYVDVPPEKVRVTMEGTPRRLVSIGPSDVAEVSVMAMVKQNPFALLVGGGSPRKNLAGAISAVREARKTIPELHLLVTGHLDRQPSEPWVKNIGPLPEHLLAAAYRGAFALLHPSLHEGFGLTILEAMALGCPVIASDRGAIPEIAGEAAMLFDAMDAEGMAGALVDLLNPAKREEAVRLGLQRAREYTWDETARATVEAYRAAIG